MLLTSYLVITFSRLLSCVCPSSWSPSCCLGASVHPHPSPKLFSLTSHQRLSTCKRALLLIPLNGQRHVLLTEQFLLLSLHALFSCQNKRLFALSHINTAQSLITVNYVSVRFTRVVLRQPQLDTRTRLRRDSSRHQSCRGQCQWRVLTRLRLLCRQWQTLIRLPPLERSTSTKSGPCALSVNVSTDAVNHNSIQVSHLQAIDYQAQGQGRGQSS